MNEYNLEYKGVKCTGVEWEDYIFYFEYLGKEYVFEQTMAISASADTDHIRIVIEEQFLPWVNKELLLEQVRKDTAREILQDLFSAREFEPLYDNDKGGYIRLKEIIELAKKYGIKVD